MQVSNAPAKLTVPFAYEGDKNVIPVPSQIPITPGAASFTDGFPPLTMVAPSAGGVPPSGLDFNGIFFDISAPAAWYCAGAGFPFDATFAAAVGGYPKGARVLAASGLTYWRSLIDNNSNNPDTGGAGWAPDGGGGAISSVYASAQQTLAVGATKVLYDTVEFDTQGQWSASNQRWSALYAGKFRISGATFLSAPSGQQLSVDIYKNGAMVKRCYENPQLSTGDLSLPFSVILNLAIGDYVEVYLNVTQTAVLAGEVGSNEAYVYSQFEYLGN